MSKYIEENIDTPSNNIMKFVFSPLFLIAFLVGLGVWVLNAKRKAEKDAMEICCYKAIYYHHKAFKNDSHIPVYEVDREDITFVGDSKRHFSGLGFLYEFDVSRAKKRNGEYVSGTAYVRVDLKIDGLFRYKRGSAMKNRMESFEEKGKVHSY